MTFTLYQQNHLTENIDERIHNHQKRETKKKYRNGMFSSLRREEMSLVDGVHDIWHIFLITHLQLDNFYL